jgi:N-methylhydantoinase A
MPFGGAGPMLGAPLAEVAGMRRVLIPAMPGTLCALGAASAAIRRDVMRTVLLSLAEDTLAAIDAALNELAQEAETAIVEMVGPGRSSIVRIADLRYRGQSFEITIPMTGLDTVQAISDAFHDAHGRQFGHADRETPIQVVNLRVSSARPAPEIRLPHADCIEHRPSPYDRTRLFLGGAWHEAALFRRDQLDPGAEVAGPAIVVQDDTTLLIPKGWDARVDEYSNVVMELS